MPEISEANATGPVQWAFDQKDLEELRVACQQASEIVVDLETTGLQEHAWEGGWLNGGVGARIVLASFTLPQTIGGGAGAFGERNWDGETPTTWVLPLSHPESPFVGEWRRVLRYVMSPAIQDRVPFTNQNIKFDARWMNATCGIDISDLIAWDTKDAWHLLDENRSTRLKVRVPQDFGIPAWDDFSFEKPGAAELVPLLDLGAYAARDTWWTWRGKERQRIEMFLGEVDDDPFDEFDRQNARLGRFATWIAMPTVASLTKVEQRGMRLDIDWVHRTLEEDSTAAAEALDRMSDYSGQDRKSASTASASHWFQAFMDKAVENGDLRITATTEKGNPTWSRIVLARQARIGSEVAQLILDARRHEKRAQFLRSWLDLVTEDGVIYANFTSGSVSTGRLSSSEPNLQQVTKLLRPAFIPREGFVIADFDYSQIELRVAAFISRSAPMIKAFQDGQDLHRLMGATIVNERRRAAAAGGYWEAIDPKDVSAEERQQAKAANFGLLYEMGAYGFQQYAETAYGVMLSMEEAVQIHAAFFTMWEGMREWHQRVKFEAHQRGYVTSPLGRVRRLPNIWDGNDKLVSFAERQAINSPVQSMASDLLQLSMASMQGLLPKEAHLPKIDGVFPVATVHDSIVAEIQEDRWEEIAQEVAHRMATLDEVLARFGVDFDVPLLADYSVGTRWSWHDVSDPDEPVEEETELAELAELGV